MAISKGILKRLSCEEIVEKFKTYHLKLELNDITKRNTKTFFKCTTDDGYIIYKSLESLRVNNVNFNIVFHKNPYNIHNIKLWIKLNRNDYILLDEEYKGYNEKYLFKYIGYKEIDDKDREFYMKLNKFICAKQDNPKLKTYSKFEIIFRKLLNTNNINFKEQYVFDDLKYKDKLRFDFCIFDKNNNIDFLVEIHGQEHYEEIKFFGGKEKFIERQIKDELKRSYCIKNNIILIEIPYKDFLRKNYIDNLKLKYEKIKHILKE